MLLTAIKFSNRTLSYAVTLSSNLAVVLAEANGDKNSENATPVFRNKAFTHLKPLLMKSKPVASTYFAVIRPV